MLDILSRWTGAVIYHSATVDDIATAVLEAVAARWNLGGANLRGANLRSADLGGANLGGANLGGANLRGAAAEPATITIIGSRHVITASASWVGIGCQNHPLDWWLEHYRANGYANGYTDLQIEEYGWHLRRIQATLPVLTLGEAARG